MRNALSVPQPTIWILSVSAPSAGSPSQNKHDHHAAHHMLPVTKKSRQINMNSNCQVRAPQSEGTLRAVSQTEQGCLNRLCAVPSKQAACSVNTACCSQQTKQHCHVKPKQHAQLAGSSKLDSTVSSYAAQQTELLAGSSKQNIIVIHAQPPAVPDPTLKSTRPPHHCYHCCRCWRKPDHCHCRSWYELPQPLPQSARRAARAAQCPSPCALACC